MAGALTLFLTCYFLCYWPVFRASSLELEEAMAAGAVPLERCGERLARVTTLGARVTTPGSRGQASNSRRP